MTGLNEKIRILKEEIREGFESGRSPLKISDIITKVQITDS